MAAAENRAAVTACDSVPAAEPQADRRIKLVRRAQPDRSQLFRRSAQGLFAALNVVLCAQFLLFVRQIESGAPVPRWSRPPGVEGWLPIAGLMNLKYLLVTGEVPRIHPAALFLLLAFLGISFAFRKSFCSWLCPVGTLSEVLWKCGRKVLGKNWILPRWLDIPLRGVKYLLLLFFAYAVAGMSAAAIQAFMASPYGLVADIKMLDFFRRLSTTAAITLVALAALSFFYQNFWCRYLCPYGALLGLASVFSPSKIRRVPEKCVDCGKCARACPALLPVDRLVQIRSSECTACLECVAACPAAGALDLNFTRRRRVPAWAVAAGIAAMFLGIVAAAKGAGVWESRIPYEVYLHLLPVLGSLQHP